MNEAATFTFGFLVGVLATLISLHVSNHDHARLETLRKYVVRVGDYVPCDTRRKDTWLDDAMGVDCQGFTAARKAAQ